VFCRTSRRNAFEWMMPIAITLKFAAESGLGFRVATAARLFVVGGVRRQRVATSEHVVHAVIRRRYSTSAAVQARGSLRSRTDSPIARSRTNRIRPPWTFLSIRMCSSATPGGHSIDLHRQADSLQQPPQPVHLGHVDQSAFVGHRCGHQQPRADGLSMQPPRVVRRRFTACPNV